MKRTRTRQPGFVLPLVMILALVAGAALVVLFTRRGSALVYANRQSDNYVSHHFLTGLRCGTRAPFAAVQVA